jgi:uncharacterized membrane protein
MSSDVAPRESPSGSSSSPGHTDGRSSGAGTPPLARFLGWFSIGLGTAQIAVPGAVARIAGVDDRSPDGATGGTRTLMRLLGAREIAAGIGILGSRRPESWLWARVAGDAMDLALLRKALRSPGNRHGRVAGALAAVGGITVLDMLESTWLSDGADGPGTGPAQSEDTRGRDSRDSKEGRMETRAAITVRRPVEEVYRYWRDIEQLPTFMYLLESVQKKEGNRSHWVVKAPAGRTVEWDAEIVEDTPNERIAWRSIDGDVPNSGEVRFTRAPGDRGTEVRVQVDYQIPGGPIGELIGKLLGESPAQEVREDLRRFKQVLETGEVLVSEGNPEGTSRRNQFPQQVAEPPEEHAETATAGQMQEVKA